MRQFLALLTLPLLLAACPAAIITGATEAGVTMAENRSAGRKVDDKILYADVTNQFVKNNREDLIKYVNINTRFARVMLTGTVKSQADAEAAVALAWKAEGIEEVINELVISNDQSFFSTANDSMVKRNLEARLLITKDVMVINYSLDIQRGTAYIIGRVKDQGELNRVLNVARTTKGIHRVVSHLQIDPGVTAVTPAAATYNNDIRSKSSPAPVAPAQPSIYVPQKGAIDAPPVSQDSTRPAGGGY